MPSRAPTAAHCHVLACVATLAVSLVLRAPGAAAVTAITNWTNGFMTFYGERTQDACLAIKHCLSYIIHGSAVGKHPDELSVIVRCPCQLCCPMIAQEPALMSLCCCTCRRRARRCAEHAQSLPALFLPVPPSVLAHDIALLHISPSKL